jgi:hypothetical protein
MKHLFIGCAAGGSGDRTDAAAPVVATLIRHGNPAALIFENLAERTLAFAQLAKRANPLAGYEPLLEAQLRPVLADCLQNGITIVSNLGAANPRQAAIHVGRLAAELGLASPRIAVIEGDDLYDDYGRSVLGSLLPTNDDARTIVSANVYQGAFEIADAIRAGAQIVITGRVADPSLVLGPAIAHYGWANDDWSCLAGATMAGHLLECGAQVTGGYFADPGFKDVPDLAHVGYPIVEIFPDGTCVVGKADHTGGLVSERTVKEQLLYEIHDPAAYLTPDVIADISHATVTEIAPNQVHLSGVRGHPRPATLKALVFFEGGWLGEGEISYAGPNAEARARLAMDVVRTRMGAAFTLRFDLIGVLSVFGDDAGKMLSQVEPSRSEDVRLRVAGTHMKESEIDRLLREVYALWLCGPAGGGGVRTAKRQRLCNQTCLIPREQVPARFSFLDN